MPAAAFSPLGRPHVPLRAPQVQAAAALLNVLFEHSIIFLLCVSVTHMLMKSYNI